MPEHTSFFSYLIAKFPALGLNLANGRTILADGFKGRPLGEHDAEPLVASAFVVVLLLLIAMKVGAAVKNYERSVIPDDKLTLRTLMEVLIGSFYDMMKDMMGPKRAKLYFPLIGTSACFIFFSNFMGLVPGLNPPTSSWNVTWGCAIVVFVMFNYYGIKELGVGGTMKHLAGPIWWMWWMIFPLEVFSTCLRPFTLSIRLMLNLAVDHLLLTIMIGIFPLFLPIPFMLLGTLIAIVQVLVFCLLSSIYISLATDHGDHAEAHGHEKKAHANEGHAHA
jgi:F-type H+-transporting ATPase subunit a